MNEGSKKTLHSILMKIKKAELPGFYGAPLDMVARLVFKGFGRGALVTRASSIAFNMLMALLPTLIFLFTLIPFIPVQNFQSDLIKIFESLMPSNLYNVFESTIVEVITQKSGTLLIFMFFATIVFSTNGIHALMHAFNVSTHGFTSRTWIQQRKIAIVMLFIILMLFSISGILIILSKSVVKRMVALGLLRMSFVFYVVMMLKWILILLILFFAISTLYYFVPAKKKEFRYFSPGSILATILFIITSLGFSAYVNNFGQYNKLYGSIGTLIVMLVWLYLNSIALLMGFELNASIKSANEEMETIA
jgi:membrane protein